MRNRYEMHVDTIDEISEPTHLAPIFHRVANRAHAFLNNLEKNVSQESIEYLRYCFSQPKCPEIDYDVFAAPFAYSYFLKNFWKAIGTFLREHPPLSKRVIDAGCGSGATTLAYLTFLDNSLEGTKWHIDVVLMDRSRVQLDLAKNLLESTCGEFQNLRIVTKFRCLELANWKPKEDSADTVLFGHVLTENQSRIGPFIEKAFQAVSGCGRVYIVERTDDIVWPTITKEASKLALPTCDGIVRFETKDIQLPRLSGTERQAYVKTRFLVLHIPERKVLVDLLRRYFKAWETKSVSVLEEVFASNAVYHDKPHQPPVEGIDEIKEYWHEHVLSQKGLQLQILRTAYGGNDAFSEWIADFIQSERRVLIKGALILTIDLDTCLVVALNEYYQSLKTTEGSIDGELI